MTVGELIDNILPTLEASGTKVTQSMLDGVQIVTDHLTTRFLVAGSDILKRTVKLSFGSGQDTVQLPSSLIGFKSEPRVKLSSSTGQSYELTALPYEERGAYLAPGPPRYFELTRKALTVYPTPDAAYDITIRATVRPSLPESLDEDVPFDGVLDHVYKSLVPFALASGEMGLINQQVESYLLLNCDRLVINRSPANIRWRFPV